MPIGVLKSLRNDIESIKFPNETQEPVSVLNSDESVDQHNKAFIQDSNLDNDESEEANQNGLTDGQIFGAFHISGMLNDQNGGHENQDQGK